MSGTSGRAVAAGGPDPAVAVIRRRGLLPLLALAGCAAPLPEPTAPSAEAEALLRASAEAHGLAAFRAIRDLSVSYEGEWPPVIGRLQPVLVDQGFRIRSEERLLPREGLVAQAHAGPEGLKQVVRRPGGVRVWYDGRETPDAERRAAAALVADGYALFLLGPMLLADGRRALAAEMACTERITVGGRAFDCDVLRLRAAPGLGLAEADRIALFIDREGRLMRRVRFTLEGLASTRGAVAEVDALTHATLHGVTWPTRFHERLLRPFPLRVHDWWLTGLDVNRGLTPADLDGPTFSARAAVPAARLAP